MHTTETPVRGAAAAWVLLAAAAGVRAIPAADPAAPPARPNILWLTCEDISPNLGCYGDAYAATPAIDRLAQQGVRYTHAFGITGVCAPRNQLRPRALPPRLPDMTRHWHIEARGLGPIRSVRTAGAARSRSRAPEPGDSPEWLL